MALLVDSRCIVMTRSQSRSFSSLLSWLVSLALIVFVFQPAIAGAQGFPGGMSGGMGGMGGRGGFHGGRGGGRGGRDGQPRDSAHAGSHANAGTLADLALRHRAELQLTDSQTTVLAGIARQARMDRINATAALASLQDTTGQGAASAPSDSTRSTLLQRRRALAAAFAQLHDVDVNARTATLALLSPTQQNALVKFESADGASGNDEGSERGAGRGGERGGERGAARPAQEP